MSKKIIDLIKNLVDEGSFIELGGKAVSKENISKNTSEVENDGVITGYATIDLKLVYIYAQDDSILGASIGKMHAKKIVNMYKMAIKMGAPIIGFVGNAGIRIEEGQDSLFSFGKILKAKSRAKGIIPQISIVTSCAGGGSSILCEMSDFLFMEEKEARLFTIAPNAIPGNKNDDNTKASNMSKYALVDYVSNMDDIIKKVRELIILLPSNSEDIDNYDESEDDINRLTPNVKNMEVMDIIKEIADNHYYFELKKEGGIAITTGFIRINGQTIGIVGSIKKVLGYTSMKKAKNFIYFLDTFNIPLLTITDVDSFNPNCVRVNELGVMAGKLARAYVDATIPKVTLIKNAKSFAGFIMGSKCLDTDIVYAFDNSQISVMDEKRAVELLYANEINLAEDKNKFYVLLVKEYGQ
ncbi:MAG: carboxyl transferase domain-containing protein, partial [Eubacteriales bacterium]|nr:carboxyl transferase domain-containing protein [Eubacteriales bacterium]